MTCPSIGIAPTELSALAGALSTPVSPPPPPPTDLITAVLTPASSRLYAGQSLADMTGFASFTAPDNFSSDAGGIADVTVAPLGTAPDVATPLAEGDTAGYRVTVTGTAGGAQTFDTALQTVEYDVRVITTSGNEVEVVLNDLVPDAESVDLDITHPPHTGLYSVLAASLRQADPFVLPGTHRIIHGPDASALTAGDVLSMQDPLAHTAADSLSIPARAWLRNGTPIPGATGASYTLATADLGTTIAPRATVEDNLGNRTVSDGAALAIRAAASAVVPVFVGSTQGISNNDGKWNFSAMDLSGVATGAKLLFLIGSRKNATHAIIDADLTDGATPVAMTLVSAGAANRCRLSAWAIDKPAGYDSAVVRYRSDTGGGIFANFVHVYEVDGAAVFDSQPVAGANVPTIDGSINVVTGSGLIVAHFEERDPGHAGITGVGGAVETSTSGIYSMDTRAEAITADDSPRAIAGTLPGNGFHSLISVHARAS